MGVSPLSTPECELGDSPKIRLTRGAQIQLDLLGKLQLGASGFLSGRDIGRYRVIERFIHFPLTGESMTGSYQLVYQKLRDRLTGVFFVNEPLVVDDWMIGDLIISIGAGKREVFVFWPTGDPEGLSKICDL
jgi:hypothetical protein